MTDPLADRMTVPICKVCGHSGMAHYLTIGDRIVCMSCPGCSCTPTGRRSGTVSDLVPTEQTGTPAEPPRNGPELRCAAVPQTPGTGESTGPVEG